MAVSARHRGQFLDSRPLQIAPATGRGVFDQMAATEAADLSKLKAASMEEGGEKPWLTIPYPNNRIVEH